MTSASISLTATLSGASFPLAKTVTVVSTSYAEATVPVATAGTLSTRTDDNTGVVTVAASPAHGITTSDKVDIYWSTGKRRTMTVSAQTSTTITVDLGAGDNFPIATTAVIICKCSSVAIAGTAAAVVFLAVYSEARGTVVFAQSDNTEVAHYDLPLDSQSRVWYTSDGTTSPIGATVAKVFFSHNNTSASKAMKAILGSSA